MASVLLYWYEVNTRDLPKVCVTCGEPQAGFALRRLTVRGVGDVVGARDRVDVELPFCPKHTNAPPAGTSGPRAKEFTDEGVLMVNVAPEFLDALDNFRELPERREREREASDDDVRPRRPPASRSSAMPAVIIAAVAALGIAAAGGGCCCCIRLGPLFFADQAPHAPINRPGR
jgi:hypothetical protein